MTNITIGFIVSVFVSALTFGILGYIFGTKHGVTKQKLASRTEVIDIISFIISSLQAISIMSIKDDECSYDAKKSIIDFVRDTNTNKNDNKNDNKDDNKE